MQTMLCNLREVKFAPDESGADAMTFSGYGAVFGNVDAYGDVIEPGAFASYLADVRADRQPWPAMLSQHGGYQLTAEDVTPIGIWTDLAEDGVGLKVSGRLANTPRGNEMYSLLKMTPRAAIDGMSIGYIPKEWEPRSKPEDPRRRLKRVDLIEVSLVTRPANSLARVSNVKSGLTIRDAERALRDVGFSQSEAKTILSSGFGTRRDAGGMDEAREIIEALRKREASLPNVIGE